MPIICSENTGGSEIVDDGINGYVIPIKNIEILKNKIQEFYYDRSKLKNFSLNALKRQKIYLGKTMETNLSMLTNLF